MPHRQPADAVVATEPRPLPPHIASGADERGFASALECLPTVGGVERLDHLRVAQRPGSGEPVAQTAAQQCPHFINQTCVEHIVGATGEPVRRESLSANLIR